MRTLTPNMSETEQMVLSLGFTKVKDCYISAKSEITGGPICHIKYDPTMGCDGWFIGEVNEYANLPNMEKKDNLVMLMKALRINHQDD